MSDDIERVLEELEATQQQAREQINAVAETLYDIGALNSTDELTRYPTWLKGAIIPLVASVLDVELPKHAPWSDKLNEGPYGMHADEVLTMYLAAGIQKHFLQEFDRVKPSTDDEKSKRRGLKTMRHLLRHLLHAVAQDLARTLLEAHIKPFLFEELYGIIEPLVSDSVHQYQLDQEASTQPTPDAANFEALLERTVHHDDPIADAVLGGLAVRQEAIRRFEIESQELALQARELGISWTAIGEAAGIARSSAYKRWDQDGREKNRESARNYVRKLKGGNDEQADA